MVQPTQETIHGLLVRNIPRHGLVMGLEEPSFVGAQRAYAAARGWMTGTCPVWLVLRHFPHE